MDETWTNKLYFGNNLPVLRAHVPDWDYALDAGRPDPLKQGLGYV
jgi:hypothetical protein